MLYAVDKYLDQIKRKQEREWEPFRSNVGTEHLKYHYFDTEKEAKAFIRDRAQKELWAADKAVVAAERRLKKCERKFSWTLHE